jgi:ribosome-associated protein
LNVARSIVNTLEEKKAEDIVLLDVNEISAITNYFIICTGTSDRMLRSLAHSIIETARKQDYFLGPVEGQPSAGWIAVDLGDIIVHLFSPAQRDYYQLEQLWQKSKLLVRVK